MSRASAIVGVLVISLSAIFVRLAGVSPDTSAFFRCLYAVPVLAALALLPRREGPALSPWWWAAFGSGALLGLDLAFWHRAIEFIGAGLATVLGNTQVIFVGFAAWALLGERPHRSAWSMVPVALTGIVLISGLGQQGAYGHDPVAGAVFGIFTGVTYAAFLVVFRRAVGRCGSAVRALFAATLGALAAAGAVGLASGELDLVPHWPAHGWLVALALGSQVIGWLLIAYALPGLPSLEGSVLLLLQPAFTILWASLLFGERLSVAQWAGVGLVLFAVAVVSVRTARDRTAVSSDQVA